MNDVEPDSASQPQKRRYEPPVIEETAAFETLALSCLKTDINCEINYGSSANS